MKISASTLLSGTKKSIELYNSSFIVKDGPNMMGTMKMCDLSIPYDSFTLSKMTLPSKGREFPVMYGFLGTAITLLVIRASYTASTNSTSGITQKCVAQDQYIEYYFENEPLVTRYMSEMLVLTGNANHRIPQVYLYNPTDLDVYVEIMMANVEPNTVSSIFAETFNTFTGLVFNDVITDQVFGINCTGSTQFEVLDMSGNIQCVIPYSKIDLISIDTETITVTTKSDDPVKLIFASKSHAYQALSRMNYVREGSISKYLTKIAPGWDATPPVVTLKTSSSVVVMSGYTYITKPDLIYRFINTIIDYDDSGVLRDGVINNANTNVQIMVDNTGQLIDVITADGYYTITFTVSDIAGNSTGVSRKVLRDGLPPDIYYKPYASMSLANYSGNITMVNARSFMVSEVWDVVDGTVPVTSVVVTANGSPADITVADTYTMTLMVTDTAGNTRTDTKTLVVSA